MPGIEYHILRLLLTLRPLSDLGSLLNSGNILWDFNSEVVLAFIGDTVFRHFYGSGAAALFSYQFLI